MNNVEHELAFNRSREVLRRLRQRRNAVTELPRYDPEAKTLVPVNGLRPEEHQSDSSSETTEIEEEEEQEGEENQLKNESEFPNTEETQKQEEVETKDPEKQNEEQETSSTGVEVQEVMWTNSFTNEDSFLEEETPLLDAKLQQKDEEFINTLLKTIGINRSDESFVRAKEILYSEISIKDVMLFVTSVYTYMNQVPLWYAVAIVAFCRVCAAKDGRMTVYDLLVDCIIVVFFCVAMPLPIAVMITVSSKYATNHPTFSPLNA